MGGERPSRALVRSKEGIVYSRRIVKVVERRASCFWDLRRENEAGRGWVEATRSQEASEGRSAEIRRFSKMRSSYNGV